MPFRIDVTETVIASGTTFSLPGTWLTEAEARLQVIDICTRGVWNGNIYYAIDKLGEVEVVEV